jgi:hypothetical protein
MPRRAKKTEKASSSSSEDGSSSDDSFDEEDEVPLSQLIPQVKKDLITTTSATTATSTTAAATTIDNSKDKTKKSQSAAVEKKEEEQSAVKEKKEKEIDGNAAADETTNNKIGNPKSSKKGKDGEDSEPAKQEEKGVGASSTPIQDKDTEEEESTSASTIKPTQSDAPNEDNKGELEQQKERAATTSTKPEKDETDEQKDPETSGNAEVENLQDLEKALETADGAKKKESTDDPAAKKKDEAPTKMDIDQLPQTVTEQKDDTKASIEEASPPASSVANTKTSAATEEQKVTASLVQKEEKTKMDTEMVDGASYNDLQEATSFPTTAAAAPSTLESDKKHDTIAAAPMEVDEASPSKEKTATDPSLNDGGHDSNEKDTKDQTSSNVEDVIVLETSNTNKTTSTAKNCMDTDKQDEIVVVNDGAKGREAMKTEASTPKDMDLDMELKKDGAVEPQLAVAHDEANQRDATVTEVEPAAPSPPSPPPKPVYVLEQWAVEVESEDEEGADPFQAFNKMDLDRTKGRQRFKKMKPFKVNIATKKDIDNDAEPSKAVSLASSSSGSSGDDIYKWLERDPIFVEEEEIAALMEEEYQDSLDFFQQPHEDQDEAYSKFQRDKKKTMLKEEIKKLEGGDKTGRRQIEIIINDLLKNKRASTDRSIDKYKENAGLDERRDMQRLRQMYTAKSNQNQEKINQGLLVLRKRHQQESQKVLQQHRQQAQQRRLPEQLANAEWHSVSQRLRVKQQRQLQDFTAKGEEVKRRCDAEYKRDTEKIRKQYEKKVSDVDRNRQNIYNRMYQGFNQLRVRYMKRHIQRILKKKDTLMQSLREIDVENEPTSTVKDMRKDTNVISPRDKVKNSMMEDKVELRPPSPIKTCGLWYKDSIHEKSSAAARHKHRKGVLSQINKQLSVEIHNEGIWIYLIVDKRDEEGSKSSREEDSKSAAADEKHFIPWGVKARDLLESLICGEIPKGYGADRFDWGDTVLINGGHIRCVMTDLRTSEETASLQRATAVTDKELAELGELQKKVKELATTVHEAEKNLAKLEKQEQDITPKVQEAIKDAEQKKIGLQNFRNKFSRYLGPGKFKRNFYLIDLRIWF